MNTYILKIRHILPAFLIITFATVTGFLLVRWLFSIQFQLIDIKEEVWHIWIPLIFPWIPILLWFRRKLWILTFKGDNDRGRLLFQMITWGTITTMLMVSQKYLTTATGKLETLTTIAEIDQKPKARYYKLTDFAVAPHYKASHTDFRTSGKHNQHLNFDCYFVAPIKADSSQRLPLIPKYWYGVVFKKQISNRLSVQEKEEKYRAFYKECMAKMDAYQYHALDHFERTPTSSDRDYFLKAIEAITNQPPNEIFVVLEPKFQPYTSRNGNKFAWIFGSFGIGLSALLLLLIWPRYDSHEHKRQLQGKKPRKDELTEMLKYLIPKGDHFATSVILNLNLLVFLLMVLSGVHLLYPNGAELLQWGANRRLETASGEWWRLVTSMFVHGGVMHLFLNIGGLAIAAIFVEPLLGRKKYFILYFLSGIAGSFTSICWYDHTISVGASGAIFGLYGAMLGLLFTNAFPEESKKSTFIFIGIYVGINLLMGLTGGIDNAAHIGGLLSGAAIGLLLYKIDDEEQNPVY